MTYNEISNSGFLYTAVIAGLLIVAVITVIYLNKCYKHAAGCGIPKETLTKIVKSSVTFAIIPSIAIVTGLLTLVAIIGTPYAWFRLSVLGSLMYELLAVNMAVQSTGLDIATATPEAFGVIMWAMCIAISIGNLFNIVLCKKVHLGTLSVGGSDPSWKAASGGIFMNALILVSMMPYLLAGGASTLTLFVSAAIGMLLAKLAQKENMRWIGEFALSFSLIGALVASVFFDGLF